MKRLVAQLREQQADAAKLDAAIVANLMVFEYIIRYSPRRRASHSVAEGFSPTASPAYRMNFSKTIRIWGMLGEYRCASSDSPLLFNNAGAYLTNGE